MFELRDYQEKILLAIREKAKSGSRRILVVLPTGGGKTHIMGSLTKNALEKDNKVLALMHRRGLVDQMIDIFEECGVDSGCIMAGREPELEKKCQVASLWTYKRRANLDEIENNRFWINAPCLLIDEAHHILNKTYQSVLEDYKDAFVIGFTATPTLSTGAGLGRYFDSLIDVVSMDELMNGGFLVPGVYFGPSDPDLSKLKIIQGDYEEKRTR